MVVINDKMKNKRCSISRLLLVYVALIYCRKLNVFIVSLFAYGYNDYVSFSTIYQSECFTYNNMQYLPPGKVRILPLPEINRRLMACSHVERYMWGKLALDLGVALHEVNGNMLSNDEMDRVCQIKLNLFVRRI